MFGAPPKDIAPHRLLRLLLQRPRPAWPIDFQFASAPGVFLCVRGVRGLEFQTAMDSMTKSKGDVAPAIIAAALYVGSLPVFASADDVGGLDSDEFDRLGAQVMGGLAIVSPTFIRSDVPKWEKSLAVGAEHPSNVREAILAGRCRDDYGERPDRYFGAALGELTDGQIMAFRACADLVAKMRKKSPI